MHGAGVRVGGTRQQPPPKDVTACEHVWGRVCGGGETVAQCYLLELPGRRLVYLSSVRQNKWIWKLMLEVALSTDTEV
jgi:hypothetical protein